MNKESVPFNKSVAVNDHDLLLAIREALRPMQTIADETRQGLPYFGNDLAGVDPIGNSHDSHLSLSHVPGRWLDALLNAEALPGMTVDSQVIDRLARWAYASVETAGMGLPAQLDLETNEIRKVSQLHNLREVLHAYTALAQYRADGKARELARSVIRAIDRYFVQPGFRFDDELLFRETGGKITGADPFPLTFGRAIGPLVKFYQVTKDRSALDLAVKLKDYCLRHVLTPDDDYVLEKLGKHTHSVTSMLSSLALLGETLGDRSLLERVRRFLEKGISRCALDFGWCLVGYLRTDLMGEINNTADIMETCLVLARAGYPGYYARTERILRGHLLPAQLLDTHFVARHLDPNDANRYRLHERARGAFGFPSPYGHEDSPGSRIMFNWDIVGGAVSGLCAAYHGALTRSGNDLALHLLLDSEYPELSVAFSYPERYLRLQIKQDLDSLTVRIPERMNVLGPNPAELEYQVNDRAIILRRLKAGTRIAIRFEMRTADLIYTFREHTLGVRWEGERILAMQSAGKRLCFFPALD
ncbi:MAG: hypothetical protein PHX81_11735 [Eubacteriales bacterium]|nr:hypothetical protein [Eubacteriales bacterium]